MVKADKKFIDIINADIKETEKNAKILYRNMCDNIWGNIRKMNKNGQTSYLYCAPLYLTNQKLYVMQDYVTFVIQLFRSEGIDVRYIFPNRIIFSWMDNRGTKNTIDHIQTLFEEDMKSKLTLITTGKKEYEKKFDHLLPEPEKTRSPLLLTDGKKCQVPKKNQKQPLLIKYK
jgi:hypothetical protein